MRHSSVASATNVDTRTAENGRSGIAHFYTFGFVVLRGFFDPDPLAKEIDRAMRDGLVPSVDPSAGGAIRFRYVPMMTGETPRSLSLLARAEAVATALLGGPVLPTRAKGTRYAGNTPWHVDSTLPIPSIGFAAYFEPLDADSGALRVLPGSHRPEYSDAIRAFGAEGMAATALPAYAIATEPGDIIVFDEHIYHASSGGGERRQWRTDYLRDPTDAETEHHTKSYFANIYAADWDGGYDVDRFPSYSAEWRGSGHPSVARLEALGVFELAAKQEDFARSKR